MMNKTFEFEFGNVRGTTLYILGVEWLVSWGLSMFWYETNSRCKNAELIINLS